LPTPDNAAPSRPASSQSQRPDYCPAPIRWTSATLPPFELAHAPITPNDIYIGPPPLRLRLCSTMFSEPRVRPLPSKSERGRQGWDGPPSPAQAPNPPAAVRRREPRPRHALQKSRPLVERHIQLRIALSPPVISAAALRRRSGPRFSPPRRRRLPAQKRGFFWPAKQPHDGWRTREKSREKSAAPVSPARP